MINLTDIQWGLFAVHFIYRPILSAHLIVSLCACFYLILSFLCRFKIIIISLYTLRVYTVCALQLPQLASLMLSTSIARVILDCTMVLRAYLQVHSS